MSIFYQKNGEIANKSISYAKPKPLNICVIIKQTPIPMTVGMTNDKKVHLLLPVSFYSEECGTTREVERERA